MTVIVDSKPARKALDRAERSNHLAARAASLAIELHAAAQGGEARRIAVLIANGAKADARMPDGRTALHVSAVRGRADAVEALLAAGRTREPATRPASRRCTWRRFPETHPRSWPS